MAAETAHGVARALSEGMGEAQGEYEAKSILLTGGAGFIASHVAIRLIKRYPEAKVLLSAFFIRYLTLVGRIGLGCMLPYT